jgi:hypothetical protein
VEQAGSPLPAFQLLWRAARLWPGKARLLGRHWRALPAALRSAWAAAWPGGLLAGLGLPEERDYAEGGVLGIINLHNVYSLHIRGAAIL